MTVPTAPAAPGPPPGWAPPGYQPPPYGYGAPGYPPPAAPGWEGAVAPPAGEPRRRRLLGNAGVAWAVAALLAATVAGLAAALAGTSSSSAPAPASSATTVPGRPFGAGGGRFAGLGVVGTVASVGSGSFVVTTRQGGTVTVDEEASTTYDQGTTSATSAAVVRGARVAVSGSRTGTVVHASRVIVLPAGGFGGFGYPGTGGTGSGAGG